MPTQNGKIDALTGVRALAAIWVVFAHFRNEFETLLPPLHHVGWLIGKGSIGVDIFFILSGFILSYTYQKSIPKMTLNAYLRFVWFRFARIYPAYLAASTCAVAIVMIAILFKLPWNPASYLPRQLLYEVFMVQQWTFQQSPYIHCWNYPDWSVSAEWFAYLFVFPLTYAMLKRLSQPWMVSTLLILCLAIYSLPDLPDHSHGLWGLFQVSFDFVAGALLYKLVTLLPPIRTPAQNLLAVITITVILASLWLNLTYGFGRLILLIGIVVFLFLLKYNGGFLPAVMSAGPMVYLGEISYSIYLTHGIDQRILKILFPIEKYAHYSAMHRVVIFIIFMGMIIGGASLLYHLVEVPARNRLRMMFFQKKNSRIPLTSVS